MAPQAEVRLWEYGVDPACAGIVREPQARPLALYVGTLSRLKGVDTLLEAFRDPRLAQVELVLLGDGPLRSAQRHAAPQVRFLGHRPVAEVRDWMAKAWCLVHPARADTSPNAVKEARAAGLPVITTRHGGQAQYVEEGVSGCFHAVGDAAGIVDGVLAFTRDRQWSLAAGAAGRDEILGVLDAHLTGSRLLAIYQEILESGKLQAA
jgi:glycosyltransferase involved in cell wall biosynthesis